ncbi:hypothetical protein [Motilimonas pumila]|uniref:Cell division protein n=1 Tax=Motilimonas pumila TaxID=2303987 RepID=A0A418Y9R9_9GAMM|nr:hypothetical protein [Motilimonas pumila]RJG38172.1 hypothetical protein D1Z90_19290 [Motilimonas pumila]
MLLSMPLQSAPTLPAKASQASNPIEATEHYFHGLLHKLTKHNRDPRWLVILDGPKQLDKRLLKQLGINTEKVLQVKSSVANSKLACLMTLLSVGSCCAVVTDLNQLEQASLNQLKQASLQGQCQGILLPKTCQSQLH